MKKILIFLAIAVFSLNLAVAQTNYKGKVKVKGNKSAVVGVTVNAVNSTGKVVATTQTDSKGKFFINVPAGSSRLEFRKTGLNPKTINVGKKKKLKVKMM